MLTMGRKQEPLCKERGWVLHPSSSTTRKVKLESRMIGGILYGSGGNWRTPISGGKGIFGSIEHTGNWR
jgi:hypothetical protein